jgi:hypothetical protein
MQAELLDHEAGKFAAADAGEGQIEHLDVVRFLERLEHAPVEPKNQPRPAEKDDVGHASVGDRLADVVVENLCVLDLRADPVVVLPSAVAVERDRADVVLARRIEQPCHRRQKQRHGRHKDRKGRPADEKSRARNRPYVASRPSIPTRCDQIEPRRPGSRNRRPTRHPRCTQAS